MECLFLLLCLAGWGAWLVGCLWVGILLAGGGLGCLQLVVGYLRLGCSFLCGIAHCGKGFVVSFWGLFASINKILILAGAIVIGLSFYGV